MLAIGVELLGGRYVATAYNDRDRAEWPPHPARLFSALVSTWGDTEPRDDAGATALAWLASQPPPRILACGTNDVAHRTVVTVFVPVNDVSVVSGPDRKKLDGALRERERASDDKARARLQKEIARLEKKLAEATAKAIAAPTRLGKGDPAHGAAILPEGRTRQPRTFPSVTPADPRFCFVWPDAAPTSEQSLALARLADRLVRLGHSSSFVSARLLSADEVAKWAACLTTYREAPSHGTHVLRWVGPRQLDALERAFELHRETEPRVLPAVFVTYAEGDVELPAPPPASLFDPSFVVLARVGGTRLPITAAPGVSRQLRRALMSALGEDIPELLSGHRADGTPSDQPHIAVVPLPVVGGPHADGALLGMALVFPRDADARARRRALLAISKLARPGSSDAGEPALIHLHLGPAGTLELQHVEWGEDPRAALRPGRWTRPSRTWATATPIALDQIPGNLHAAAHAERAEAFALAERSVAAAVERIGLPAPAMVDVLRSCVLSGTAKPRSHGPFPLDTMKMQRVLVHARLVFREPVRGPLLLGAGRYQGMGLCLPTDEGE